MNKEDRIRQLIQIIDDLNYHYYSLDDPKVSDKEYDQLYDELVALEKETGLVYDYSPSQRVGGEILARFEKHDHLAPLWSLDKSQSYEDLLAWDNRVKRLIADYNNSHEEKLAKVNYILEYKFDGLTINLTYYDGHLVQAATRGNGTTGEAILEQVKTIRNIPLQIDYKGRIEVQGEGLMPLSALEAYNKKAEQPLKNARNAAAGALRNLDTSVTASRNLAAYFYNVGYIEGRDFDSQRQMLEFLKDNRLPVFFYAKSFDSMETLIDEIEKLKIERETLDLLTDGLVIKIDDIAIREILGYTNRFPRWAMAYKFEAEEVSTRILDVVWSVGRTGKLTPTAHLESVEIAGAMVSRATLNNYDDIVRKQARLNGRVLLRRSNDVIPEILGSLPTDEETFPIEKPSHCPACQTELVQDGVHIFCPNSLSCPPQLVARIDHFASRDAMNIEGFSEKTAQQLLEELDIRELPQLYTLSFDQLMGLEGFKEKKSQNLIDAIENSKDVSLASFIYALGINNVGIKTAGDLADNFKNLDNLRQADFEDLIQIDDVGPIVAQSILDFFKDPALSQSIDKLIKLGVNPHYEEVEAEESIFTDKAVVITGSFEGLNRKEIQALVEEMGGIVRGSVSGKTDYVIVGENPGSKFTRAEELNINIIDQEQLRNIISN